MFHPGEIISDTDVESCAQFAEVLVYEGGEHVADLLTTEVGGMGREAGTDCSAPGRLRGRHAVYR